MINKWAYDIKPTLMLIGLGGLGSVLLELLAREAGLGRIIVGSRSIERGVARCNLARLGALAQGYAPAIRFVPLDLDAPDAVAEIVRREAPDVIIRRATVVETTAEEWEQVMGVNVKSVFCCPGTPSP